MAHSELSLAQEFDAALAWWRAAGVDCDFSDDATAWLSDAPAKGAAPATAEAPAKAQAAADPAARTDNAPPAPITLRRDLLGESPPADLATFRDWWLSAPGLDTARAYPRIAPRGSAGAALMVLVPQPEQWDREALLSGPQGKLLANILAAMGLAAEQTYIASALPCHTPMADLAALAAGGMDAVTAHHIALVRPARVLALGTGLAPMLTEINLNPLSRNNHAHANHPVMMSETLEAMMDMPRLKARFWRRWMEWSASC